MNWYWIVLIVAAVLLALVAIAGYACFFIACVRTRVNPMDETVLERSSFQKYKQQMKDGWNWIEAHPFETVQVQSEDGLKLTGHYLPARENRAILLLFHGYRSCYQVDFGCSVAFYHEQGYSLLLVDERAHQQSEGKYITFGVKERHDVLTWVGYVNQRFGADTPLFLGGLSMGATTVQMACGLALPKNIRGVIADCGFTSPYEIMKPVAKRYAHALWRPAVGLIGIYSRLFAGFRIQEYSTLRAQRKNNIPTLFIHGTDDHFVPCEMTERNYKACACRDKKLLLFEGAGHGVSYLIDTARYQSEVTKFLSSHL